MYSKTKKMFFLRSSQTAAVMSIAVTVFDILNNACQKNRHCGKFLLNKSRLSQVDSYKMTNPITNVVFVMVLNLKL